MPALDLDDKNVDLGDANAADGNVGPVNYGLAAMTGEQAFNTMGLNNSNEAAMELRRSKAFDLRVDGKTYRQIAAALGVDVRTAYTDVQAVMERTKKETNETAEHWRQISLARLEKALSTVKDAFKAVLIDPQTGMPIDDTQNHDLRLKAIDRLIKLEERKAKLLGMDAPAKVEAAVTNVSLDDIDALKKGAEQNES